MTEQNEPVKKRITVEITPRWAIVPAELRSILVGAVMAMLGAAALALADFVATLMGDPKFVESLGVYAPFAAALISVAVNAIRKWATKSVVPAEGSKPL